jgi:hypothetical protein
MILLYWPRYWMCPGCGTIRGTHNLPAICWKCGVVFELDCLIEAGLTSDELRPFIGKINSLFDLGEGF